MCVLMMQKVYIGCWKVRKLTKRASFVEYFLQRRFFYVSDLESDP